jgi:hypothetical protein
MKTRYWTSDSLNPQFSADEATATAMCTADGRRHRKAEAMYEGTSKKAMGVLVKKRAHDAKSSMQPRSAHIRR